MLTFFFSFYSSMWNLVFAVFCSPLPVCSTCRYVYILRQPLSLPQEILLCQRPLSPTRAREHSLIDHPRSFAILAWCAGPNSPCRPSSDSALERARPVPEQEEEEARRPNRGNGKRLRPMQPLRRIDRARRRQLWGLLLLSRSNACRWARKCSKSQAEHFCPHSIRFLRALHSNDRKKRDQQRS